MAYEIWVAGFPSTYGGADTELDHLIDLLRGREVEVTLVPMFGADHPLVQTVRERGCRIEGYRPDVFADRVVVSFCNGNFLDRLPEIVGAGRPRAVVWFNCMTWLFERERDAHAQGWLDYFGFVSRFQHECLVPELELIAPVRVFRYRPHFNPDRFEWHYRRWAGTYNVGRISRDDADKFAADTWRIFDRVLVPGNLEKKVFILGYGPNAAAKIGPAPAGLDWRTWSPDEIPASSFYRTIDTMVHKTGGSRESYCRVVLEAYAHGVVPIVEDAYAFPELVIDGVTGFVTSDSDEMSYDASVLANDPRKHRLMAEAGRAFLVEELVDEEASWRAWEGLLEELEPRVSRPAVRH
jgi:glycosyltransferase involved in cell wall biosynthesis